MRGARPWRLSRGGGGLPVARSQAAEQGWEGPCRPPATGQKGGSCGAARPERCAEPQPLSGTCHAQGQGGGPSWSRSTPPPQLPPVVLAPTALQRGVCPDSHAGESLRWPEPWEGARGLEWGVEGGATEEPSTAGPVPIRPAPRLVAPEGHWPCGGGQSSAWRASEVATEETLANA